MSRVAAIDCGTNAIRLLIADVDAGGLRDCVREMVIVRLGEGVDQTGSFAPAALERTFAAIDEFAIEIQRWDAMRIRFVATSASRDVANRDEFIGGIRARLGIEPDVIPGTEEAALSFIGATRGLPSGLLSAPSLVVDIGGGSTEFILGSSEPELLASVNIGCVRMTERHAFSNPPTHLQIAAAQRDIESAVAQAAAQVPFERAACLVGLAGTVTTVSAMAIGLDRYDAEVLHGSVISAGDVARVSDELLRMTHDQRAALPFMHPGRVDVIGAGSMVLRAIVEAGGFPGVIVSETDILDGIAYSLGA